MYIHSLISYLEIKKFGTCEELRKEVVPIYFITGHRRRGLTLALERSDDGFAAHLGTLFRGCFLNCGHDCIDGCLEGG